MHSRPTGPVTELPGLVVTTVRGADDRLRARAAHVADVLGAPLVSRQGIAVMGARTGAAWCYVVGAAKEAVVGTDGATFFVQPGLLKMKLQEGARHPYLRALSSDGQRVTSLLDATLGLAGDALHAAAGLEADIVGVERSPVMQCLLEEGLARLARPGATWAAAAARIALARGDALDALRARADASIDVVAIDPMMSRRRRAAPAFNAYRPFAAGARASAALLREAARVARRRVVLKLGKGAPAPADLAWTRVVPGAHVVYLVHER